MNSLPYSLLPVSLLRFDDNGLSDYCLMLHMIDTLVFISLISAIPTSSVAFAKRLCFSMFSLGSYQQRESLSLVLTP